MKNKRVEYIIVVMLFIIICVIISFFRYNYLSIDKKIQNKIWYKYNYNNGLYDTLYLSEGKVDYFKPTSTNNTNSLDNCKKYTFDKMKKVLKLDCNKEIRIVSFDDNSLSLDFDSKNEKFFSNIEDSLNYEFESYFQKSIIDYKKERSQVTEVSKINEAKLYEVLKSDVYSKVLFIGDKCSTIDCTLALDIMEKWISTNESVYYFDVKDLNQNIINYINKIGTNKYEYEFFNGIYPRVIVSSNNKLIDQYEIKCIGFNCTKYYKNEF